MDGKFQTAFIPKKPVVSPVRVGHSGTSLFMVVSIFIFVISLALAGSVFGGQKYLSAQLEKDKVDFAKAQEAFDVLTIETLVKLDKRIESAKKILNNHIAVSPIFDYLESKTLKNARFKRMEFSFSKDNVVELDMKGEARNFSAVALQSDVFVENKNFKNPMISDIDLIPGGNVTFSFKTQVEPNFALYKSMIGADDNKN